MGFVINTNIPVSIGLNNLRLNGLNLKQGMERLSSGVRINRGADDPSGLAISNGMRARLGGLSTAMQNIQDNINMMRTAESGLNEVTDMTNRIRELVIRGANEATFTDADRRRMQDEIDSLVDGINQIGIATTYNTKHITSSVAEFNKIEWVEGQNLTVNDWAGPNPPSTGPGDPAYDTMKERVLEMLEAAAYKVFGRLGIGPAAGSTMTVTFTDVGADGQGPVIATGGGGAGAMTIDIDVYHFLDPDGGGAGRETIGYDPTVHSFTPEMILAHEMTHAILVGNGIAGSAWGQEMMASYVSGEGDLRINGNEAAVAAAVAGGLTSAPASSAEYAEVYLAGQYISETFGADKLYEVTQRVAGGSDWDAAVQSALGYTAFATFEAESDAFSTTYMNNGRDNSVAREGLGWTQSAPDWSNRWMQYGHVGPDSPNNLLAATPWISTGALDYTAFANVITLEQAQNSLHSLDRAQIITGDMHVFIGVQERRMQHILDDVQAEYINLTASRSRINDTDMASEIAEFTKAQILQQSATATIAQANSSTSVVLDLLNASIGG